MPTRETNYNKSAVDPYGYAMRKIMYGLLTGLRRQGQMNEYELETLQRIYVLIEERDPHALTIKIDER